MYCYTVRGTVDERITLLFNSLGQTDAEGIEINYPIIKEVKELLAQHLDMKPCYLRIMIFYVSFSLSF